MAALSKTQLQTDINADATLTANQKTILNNMVDSYEDAFPNLNTTQRNALTPVNGQIIYNTDVNRLEYWNGSAWFGVGQNISTPLVVKIDLTSADILALHTTPITIASAIGAGYALVPVSMAYRYTYGTVAYTGSYNVVIINNGGGASNSLVSMSSTYLNAAADRSGILSAGSGSGVDGIIENADLELFASAQISTGDGVLTVWVTYSVIEY